MTHEQLKEKFLKAMGGKPPMAARSTWGNFLRNQETEFFLNYDWIKDSRFYGWLNTDVVQWSDGAQGIKIWIEK